MKPADKLAWPKNATGRCFQRKSEQSLLTAEDIKFLRELKVRW